MSLYDTHFHLDLQSNKTLTIDTINANKIYTIAMTNVPALFEKETLENSSPYVRIALGFHPELIHEYSEQIPLMWEKLSGAKYIGEVGLDFMDTLHQKAQLTFFTELINRCRRDKSKIISIHSRKSEQQVLDIIGDDFDFLPILHWYTGNKRILRTAIDRGYYISVNYKMIQSSKFISMIDVLPKERLLLETDSPFTSMVEAQDALLKKSQEGLAKYFNLDTESMSIILWNNFNRALRSRIK